MLIQLKKNNNYQDNQNFANNLAYCLLKNKFYFLLCKVFNILIYMLEKMNNSLSEIYS